MRPAPHVIVCGAGLTGLTTAWHLQRGGVNVTVLDAADVVGGVIATTRRDGYLVEHGPNSCMLTSDLAALVDALDLTPSLRPAAPEAQRRFIVRDGAPLEVPSSPGALLKSRLFSTGAKLRLFAEPFVSRRTDPSDESVADFIRRRLGREPLAWAVDPFVSGVYAGDPEQLSVSHAFPRLAALEREHGSLLRGGIAAGRKARVARAQLGSAASRATMVSFTDGMVTLPYAIADAIGRENIRCRTRVVAMDAHDGGSRVTVLRDGVREELHADLVISTLPLHAFEQVAMPTSVHAAVSQLVSLPYPAVTSLALGFRRSDVAHALDGFGMLVPSGERRTTMGVLFSSTLFDGRAPEGYVLLTCFVGGVRRPELGDASTATLLELVEPELSQLLGVRGVPKFVHRTTWPRAIPQYNLGHDA
ncbi:MAG TPA: protoporphyrinogen oxidase, partial [Gemmatimonadaceae bacterium]|nr:protoporphyrinogen oxidase [Gemmatimonadaceae bacterium]